MAKNRLLTRAARLMFAYQSKFHAGSCELSCNKDIAVALEIDEERISLG